MMQAIGALSYLTYVSLPLRLTLSPLSYRPGRRTLKHQSLSTRHGSLCASKGTMMMMMMMLARVHFQMSVSHYWLSRCKRTRCSNATRWILSRWLRRLGLSADVQVTYSMRQLHCPTADPAKCSNLCVYI